MPLSYKEVAEILKIIDASSCEEVVLELENTRLVVRRGGSADNTENLGSNTDSPSFLQENQTSSSSANTVVTKSANPPGDNNIIVRSPMVGTFFSRPSPNEASFVNEGTKVIAGDTICLIEVMKLYTSIEATTDGVIESILAKDGSLVEYDQPLFVISSRDS